MTVNTLEFLLFLFTQQLSTVSLKSKAASDEEWPTMRPQTDEDAPCVFAERIYSVETQRYQFVQRHLSDMVRVIVEPGLNMHTHTHTHTHIHTHTHTHTRALTLKFST